MEGEALQVVEVVGGRSWSPDCLGNDSLLDALRSVAFSAGLWLKAILCSAIRSSGRIGGAEMSVYFFQNFNKLFLAAKKQFLWREQWVLCGVACARSIRYKQNCGKRSHFYCYLRLSPGDQRDANRHQLNLSNLRKY